MGGLASFSFRCLLLLFDFLAWFSFDGPHHTRWATATAPGQGQAGGSPRPGRWEPPGQAGGLWLQEGDAVPSWLLCRVQPASEDAWHSFCWPGSGACNLGEQRSGTQQHEECLAKEAPDKMIRKIQGGQTKGRTTQVQTLQETPSADEVSHGWQHHA